MVYRGWSKIVKQGLCLLCFVAVFLCSVSRGWCDERGETEALTIESITRRIQDTKDRLLRDSQGLSLTYTLGAFANPEFEFGLSGNATICNVIKWPELYIDVTGVNVEDGSLFHRTSVYDFLHHRTVALDPQSQKATFYPARFFFSSGHSDYYKYLHMAEGHQFYRDGVPFTQEPTVPECFARGDYHIVGIEEIDGEQCVHLQKPGDDIWISLDHGEYVHKREMTSGPGEPHPVETRVLSYRLVDPSTDFWIPQRIRRKDYYGPADDPDKQGQVKLGLEINVTEVSQGGIDDAIFVLNIPVGYHVSDLLVEENYYVKQTVFEKLMDGSHWIFSTLIVLALLIAVPLISFLLYSRRQSRVE
ncbi:MAG: hypothetical protein ACIAZJ_14185 [Gimesia chilikensis]|uniref:hypothetical protein n=1 Tax=Gimesia chilikensis TaxID=2605989 RepID=UPI0037B005C8